MYCIEMEHILKKFQEKVILKDVSIKIKEGEFFGLLGPSGAGKTTLIKVLTGQLPATEGSARLFGKDCWNMERALYRNIGMVLDTSGLYDRLSCYDNLKLFAQIYGIKRSRIQDGLLQVGLGNERKTIVRKLSKGMRQRLVLARAMLHQPKILFLDEPTSGLDPSTAAGIHEMLSGMQQSGTTIFLTTHNMEEASKLCGHIALLNDGNIVEYGAPEELCRKYNTENQVSILCRDGKTICLPNNQASAAQIAECFAGNIVEAIHSSEPNLETVFMQLTGRTLK